MFPRGVCVCDIEFRPRATLYRYVLVAIVLLPPGSTGGLDGLNVWHGPALRL